MGKREEAKRELEHALAAIGDARDSYKYDGVVRADGALARRNAQAWTAYTNAIVAVRRLTDYRRPKDAERFAMVSKLALVMLDILLGEEE